MLEVVKKRQELAGPRVVETLQRNHFDAYYVSTAAEALDKIVSLIPKEHVVSWGGSMTMKELGVQQRLAQEGYQVLDRDTVSDPQEREEMLRRALLCDTYIMSSNAISADGQLFNIDGTGNRVAALCFGPKSVIVVAGMNKVVGSMEEAYSRVRHYAAPCNMQRFGDRKTPCAATGLCGDCHSTDGICNQMVATRNSRPVGRIKVILVGEDLGI